ncbi:MAG: Gfo/Idh/MocA family oxidoreductase [Chloroflexota bacterium]|nr:Gfo/Idh/MocA family oxidoreductase [Chloroflexota bacterium]
MSKKIRWGILSTARIGRRVIPAIHASRNGEVAAVGSRSLERAEAWAAQQQIPRAYGSYEELLADGEIDAIYNPLPNSMHAEWSIKCAQAGIPTLSEKPFASDAPEAQSIVDAFAERNLPLAEAFMYRFHRSMPKSSRSWLPAASASCKSSTAASLLPFRTKPTSGLARHLLAAR